MEEKNISQMRKELQEFYFQRVKNNLERINQVRIRETINSYASLCLLIGMSGLVLYGFLRITFLVIIGIVLLICAMLVLNYNNKDNTSNVIQVDSSAELAIKKDLMNDFLKIFGDFTWSKGGNNRSDLTFFQDIYKLNIMNFALFGNIDDSIRGKFNGVNFRILEYDTSFSISNLISFFAVAPFVLGCGCASLIFFLGVILMISFMTKFFTLLWLIPIIILVVLLSIIISISKYVPFRGVFIEFDMNKNFEGHTFLYENAPTNRGLIRKNSGFERVILEDVDFCDRYEIFSDNQVEARFVLTPAFIERFKNMKVAFDAKYIRAAFKDNKITIAINADKDLFAMASLNEETGSQTFVELFEEILSVLQLIEVLKLDQKTGL